jgi:hypothetical protein
LRQRDYVHRHLFLSVEKFTNVYQLRLFDFCIFDYGRNC